MRGPHRGPSFGRARATMRRSPQLARIALGVVLLAMASRVEGADSVVVWTQAPISPPEWDARVKHAAVILRDGEVLSLGGDSRLGTGGAVPTPRNDVFSITSGGTTLTRVAAAAAWSVRSGHCAVRFLRTDDVLVIGGTSAQSYVLLSDAWRSTDRGATFVQTSNETFAPVMSSTGFLQAGRRDFGCFSTGPATVYAMGGGHNYLVMKSKLNDVIKSNDSGATWLVVNTSACPAMWEGRERFAYVYMPQLGRAVIVGGATQGTSRLSYTYHNDVWVWDIASSGGTVCWEMSPNRPWNEIEGYINAQLVVAPFSGDEVLLLVGGGRLYNPANSTAALYPNTVQRSVDGGWTWSIVTSVGAALPTGIGSALVSDAIHARLVFWGGSVLNTKTPPERISTAGVWIAPTSTALVSLALPFSVIDAFCMNSDAVRTCRVEGGELLTIVGTNFADVTGITVLLNGRTCTDVHLSVVPASNSVMCTTPCFDDWSGAAAINVTALLSSTMAPIAFESTESVRTGIGALSATTATAYSGIVEGPDYVCSSAPVIVSIECLDSRMCSLAAGGAEIKASFGALLRVSGANFGHEKPTSSTVSALSIMVGASGSARPIVPFHCSSVSR